MCQGTQSTQAGGSPAAVCSSVFAFIPRQLSFPLENILGTDMQMRRHNSAWNGSLWCLEKKKKDTWRTLQCRPVPLLMNQCSNPWVPSLLTFQKMYKSSRSKLASWRPCVGLLRTWAVKNHTRGFADCEELQTSQVAAGLWNAEGELIACQGGSGLGSDLNLNEVGVRRGPSRMLLKFCNGKVFPFPTNSMCC